MRITIKQENSAGITEVIEYEDLVLDIDITMFHDRDDFFLEFDIYCYAKCEEIMDTDLFFDKFSRTKNHYSSYQDYDVIYLYLKLGRKYHKRMIADSILSINQIIFSALVTKEFEEPDKVQLTLMPMMREELQKLVNKDVRTMNRRRNRKLKALKEKRKAMEVARNERNKE